MNNELERIGKEVVIAWFEVFSCSCPDVLRWTVNIRVTSVSWGVKSEPPSCERKVLATRPWQTVLKSGMCGVVSRVQLSNPRSWGSVRGIEVQSCVLNCTLSHGMVHWHWCKLTTTQACMCARTHTHTIVFEQFVVITCDVQCEICDCSYSGVFSVQFVNVLMCDQTLRQ
jgi:hypothetical protein